MIAWNSLRRRRSDDAHPSSHPHPNLHDRMADALQRLRHDRQRDRGTGDQSLSLSTQEGEAMNCPKYKRRMRFVFRLEDARFSDCPSCAMMWAKPDGGPKRLIPPFIPPQDAVFP